MQWETRPFDGLMRQALLHESFDFDRPEPMLAWEAFKSFLARPIEGQKTITIGFMCYNADDRDRTLWLEFARKFEDETGLQQGCGCGFSRPAPDDLIGVDKGYWWWAEHGTVDEWIRDVETMPEFIKCVCLPGWRFEGYSL